jgi:hypothetical protein
VQRIRNRSFTAAMGVSLILGGALGYSSPATAQPTTPGMDPGFFPATGYRIGSPALLNYFQHRGAVRTFGYPVSNEFPLLGRRVQIFQRQMLEIAPDGSVTASNILDPDVLPISGIDGLSLPPAEPEVLGAAPSPADPEYTTQALAFINVFVPDEWNALPVNFQSTFLNTVGCAEAFGTDPCDPSQLPTFALEVWGLPTSSPTSDPLNSDFVYQRFQRGIMHYSHASGTTQGLLIGDWLKRVIIGVDLSPDMGAEIRDSRFFAQYSPSRPLAVDRPNALPDTSLAQAFKADTLSAAAPMDQQVTPTLPPSLAATATTVAMTATAVSATLSAFQGTPTVLSSTPTLFPGLPTVLPGTPTPFPGTQPFLSPTATAPAYFGFGTPTVGPLLSFGTPTLGAVVSSTPVDNLGCFGDEQMWFVPPKPNLGLRVSIVVTSQRHHDVRALTLSGPLEPGPVTERLGPLGFVWTWVVVPTVQDFHRWTFYADGFRGCVTSGFNTYPPLGATATPTITRVPTNTSVPSVTPTASVTPTGTVIAAPTITDVTPATGLGCSSIVTLRGSNFGSPPSGSGTGVFLISGSRSTTLQQIGTGSNTQIRVQMPSSAITAGVASSVQASNSSGDSALVPVTFSTGCV